MNTGMEQDIQRTGGFRRLELEMGYEYFDAWYDLAKISTTVNDPDKDWIFGSYKRFMGVLDELRA